MSVPVKTTVTVTFKSWNTPNFANFEDKANESKNGSIRVEDLELDALNAMAEAWLNDLYEKAGHTNPWGRRAYRG